MRDVGRNSIALQSMGSSASGKGIQKSGGKRAIVRPKNSVSHIIKGVPTKMEMKHFPVSGDLKARKGNMKTILSYMLHIL